MSTNWGRPILPPALASRNEVFTSGGLLIWQSLNLPGIKFLRRIREYSYNSILDDVKDKRRAVLLEVNNGTHWVLAIRKAFIRQEFLTMDPLYGAYGTAISDHWNITGSAHFLNVSFSFRQGLSTAQIASMERLSLKPFPEWSKIDKENWKYATNGSPPPS